MGNMTRKPIIIGDSCADLPASFSEGRGVERLRFSYLLQEQNLLDNSVEEETDQFYTALAAGNRAHTSQVNTQIFYDHFKSLLATERPIIYVGFSSKLSATLQSAENAAERLCQEYPQADITVVDSKAASVGEGLVLRRAVLMAEEGHSRDEIVDWLTANRTRMHHLFTVDELTYLQQGGRLTAAAAFLGDMLNIKPLMLVDQEGYLMAYKKERGRKRVLKTMVQELEQRVINPESQVMAIGYGMCREDAEELREMVLAKYQVPEIILSRIGPVIGGHVGPTVLAFFFWGQPRQELLHK